MEGPLGKLYSIPVSILMVIGLGLSVFLFYTLMKAAEEGKVLMVIILAVSISIVAFLISRAIKFQIMKEL
ncbi:MAG: hypothetical protein QCH31_05745 [Methanolobus sp.]|nr:hypothetical protein [Methanolobus sp.]